MNFKTQINLILKQAFDIILSFVLFLFLFPFLFLISVLICLESKGSPFFLQERIGKNMKVFKIIKFRTMVLNAEKIGTGIFTNEGDSRITKVGRILRKYSLDELSQIFNIIKGDMSFIGPRPPVTYHPYKIDEYPVEFIKRFSMKPGITGLAQISGRANLTWHERFKYDLIYIENYSILKDINITFNTVKKVFMREDVFPTETFIEKNHKIQK